MRVDCVVAQVLLWQWRDTLHTSNFVDDVFFSHNEPYHASCKFISSESVTTETIALVLTKFCSSIQISKYASSVAHWGRSLLSYPIYDCLVLQAECVVRE